MDGVEPVDPIPTGDARGLAREAAKVVRTLRYLPRVVRDLPALVPSRRLLTHPAGVSVNVADASVPSFSGVERLAEYLNSDTFDPPRACGPAALATLVTYWGTGTAAALDGQACVNAVMRRHKPSLLGLSPAQMAQGAATEGLGHGGWIEGDAMLKRALGQRLPAVVLLDLHGLGRGNEMHWVVAHAFDADHIYVSNWAEGRMTWPEFRAATNTWRTRPLRTANRYLVTWP